MKLSAHFGFVEDVGEADSFCDVAFLRAKGGEQRGEREAKELYH